MRHRVDPRFSDLDVPPPQDLPELAAREPDSFVADVESGAFESRAQIRAAHLARPGRFYLSFAFAAQIALFVATVEVIGLLVRFGPQLGMFAMPLCMLFPGATGTYLLRWLREVVDDAAAGVRAAPAVPDPREIEESLSASWTWLVAMFLGALPVSALAVLGVQTVWLLAPLGALGIGYMALAYVRVQADEDVIETLPPAVLLWVIRKPLAGASALGLAAASIPMLTSFDWPSTAWSRIPGEMLCCAALVATLRFVTRQR